MVLKVVEKVADTMANVGDAVTVVKSTVSQSSLDAV